MTSLSPTEAANLVAALLTVNLYPLDRAHALMPAFEARGLLDPATVAALPQEALVASMTEAGYRRGGFLPIVSFRLYALMDAIAAGTLDVLRDHVAKQDRAAFVDVLSGVSGFGPSTAGAAWALWGEPAAG
ncbi:MAG: hypothetical protein Q8P18_17095 [Pseudomonadota bacterium]|nr:hypothetical protein [Pseudomonadota bacterium]